MKLTGLSRYDVVFAEGAVKIQNRRSGRVCSPYTTPSNSKLKWRLVTDCGARKDITIGQLRFQMKHPEVSADSISCRGAGIKFNDDGSVSNLYGGERGRSYARFTSAEDALNTILFLISAHEGDKVPLLRFVDRSRWNAITTVAKLLKCGIPTVAQHFETAAARFLRETEEFNVERVQPLFAWLCKCLRWVVREQRSLKIKTTDNMERFGGVRLAQMD